MFNAFFDATIVPYRKPGVEPMTDEAKVPNYDPNSDDYHYPPKASTVEATPDGQSESWTGRDTSLTPSTHGASVPVPATDGWDNPMLKSVKDTFNGFANAVVRASELTAKVDRLQRTVDALQATQNDLMNERMELRIKLREAEEAKVSAEEHAAQMAATLDYEKGNHSALRSQHDNLYNDHQKLIDAHDNLQDDHDLAVLEKQDWLDKHDKLAKDYEAVVADLAQARAQWFKQEDDLQAAIRSLTAERNSFRDKFDSCKSHAAKIMALDQVKAEAPQSNEAFH
jgi:septal ring factor EnvC (AmiA/AmiB activator)